MNTKIKLSLAATILALFVGSAVQAQTTFFGETLGAGEGVRVVPNAATVAAQTNFLASLTSPGVENFEGAFVNTAIFGNGVTATLLGGALTSQGAGTNGFGRYPTSGTQYWTSETAFSLTFNQGVAAFGFFGVDIGDFSGQLSLTLFSGVTNLGNFIVPNIINGTGGGILYYGIITPFTFDRVSFGNTAPGSDVFGFDDFTVGLQGQVVPPPGAVPEPSTYGLIGAAALVGAVMIRRRLQAKKTA